MALAGVIFVPRSGIPWEVLRQKMGCGSGMTCWRRLRDWQEPGVWEWLYQMLKDRLGDAERKTGSEQARILLLSRQKWDAGTGQNPTERGKPRTKRYLVVDRRGTPLNVLITGGNGHD